MVEITNELICEILKRLRTDIGEVKKSLADNGRQLIRIREEIQNIAWGRAAGSGNRNLTRDVTRDTNER